jgi:hypothetical protein
MSIRRVSLLSGFAALALLVAGAVDTASAATQRSNTRLTQHSDAFAKTKRGDASASALNSGLVIVDQFGGKKDKMVIKAPSFQDADARARAKNGAAFAEADNSVTKILTQDGGSKQRIYAPTKQRANADARSKNGPATAVASNDAVITVGQSR